MKDDTRIVTTGRHPEDHHGAVNTPVYHASTILFPTVAALRDANAAMRHENVVYYGRRGTPTSFALEEAIADLEGGHDCRLTPSGLSAVTTALLSLLESGDHLLMTDSVYDPTRVFCDRILTRMGVETTYYDPLIGGDIAGLMKPNTRVVFVESPGSLTFEVQDIPAIATAAHKGGAKVIMDNTWATPLFFRPFEHGVDISVQAATKYIVGHSDAMLGSITANEECWQAVRTTVGLLGLCAGPDDIYLGQRGLRTLGVRLRQHQESALALAKWLQQRPEVNRVLHPALPDDPGHALWQRDFKGASGLFGMVLNPCSDAAVAAMLDNMSLFKMGFSWGGFESLILPVDPASARSATAWPPAKQEANREGTQDDTQDGPCLRVHAGLEDVSDLIADLEAGFTQLNDAG